MDISNVLSDCSCCNPVGGTAFLAILPCVFRCTESTFPAELGVSEKPAATSRVRCLFAAARAQLEKKRDLLSSASDGQKYIEEVRAALRCPSCSAAACCTAHAWHRFTRRSKFHVKSFHFTRRSK